ncbi:GTP-binding protein [Gryganskiella cystojenkinii]|nr:GTP-binding protein [Gryganskiella cystojenkinii]
MDKHVFVQMNGARKVTGVLRGFDPFMNLVLDEAVEEVSPTEKKQIGMVPQNMSPTSTVTTAPATTRVRRIVLLGSRAVGKSSMIIQYVDNVFTESYFPTIERTFTKPLTFRGQQYEIQIIDTAGQDEFSIFNGRHALDVHGYVLVYSVTSRQSFDMISVIRDKILNFTGTDWVPIVIVGNKTDLTSQRQVSREESEDLAAFWKCLSCETSAKTNVNIGRAFELMMAEIEKSTQDAPNPEGQKKEDICVIQ